MTVRKGEPWGIEGVAPDDLAVAGSDSELHALLNESGRLGEHPPVVALTGGGLWRTVGGALGRRPPHAGESCALLGVDLGVVTVGERDVVFAGHLVARRSWWRGEVVAVMNAQYLDGWDVAPRAHPNDGRLDVLHVRSSMSVADRWKARARLPTGTHVPHPDILQSRVEQLALRFERALDLHADGVHVGREEELSVRVLPDALTVAI